MVPEPRALLIKEDENYRRQFSDACPSIGIALDLAQTSPGIKQFASTQLVGLIYEINTKHLPRPIGPHIEHGSRQARCLLDHPRLLSRFFRIPGINFNFPNHTKPQDQSPNRY
jgi:hypothetical protein